ncbi:MAG: glycosyltransferase family 4 protein [Clostridiaceae bacterium]|nr:glycosyltransferase family 4 protein [Clostridiaceae bacterium]MDY5889483.1 glycosyltransferase family 4 protein [Oscillospiraceae bacterium]
MKIYEIGTGYTPIPAKVAAATESVVEELTKAFMQKKIDVEVIDISANDRVPNSLPITEVKVPSIFTKSDISLGIIHKVKRVVYSVALALKLKKILKQTNQKTVLHFHNQYNIYFFLKLVKKELRDKAIIAYTNHNGFWSLPFEKAKSTLQSRYFQEIEGMKNADLIFVLNPKMKNNIVENLGIDENKVIRINNGVNTDVYAPLSSEQIEKVKEKLNLKNKRIILQVGSVNENKGQGRAVKMIAPLLRENSDTVYAFAGDIVSQEYYQEVLRTAKEEKVENQVVYLGTFSPGEEMNGLYNIADTAIFVSRYEGFSLACVESISAGVPVVLCSDSLSSFGDGSILAERQDVADRIRQLLNDGDLLKELKQAARKNAVENFTWSKTAQKYFDNFNI